MGNPEEFQKNEEGDERKTSLFRDRVPQSVIAVQHLHQSSYSTGYRFHPSEISGSEFVRVLVFIGFLLQNSSNVTKKEEKEEKKKKKKSCFLTSDLSSPRLRGGSAGGSSGCASSGSHSRPGVQRGQ